MDYTAGGGLLGGLQEVQERRHGAREALAAEMDEVERPADGEARHAEDDEAPLAHFGGDGELRQDAEAETRGDRTLDGLGTAQFHHGGSRLAAGEPSFGRPPGRRIGLAEDEALPGQVRGWDLAAPAGQRM